MLRADVERVRQVANAIAESAVKAQVDQLIKQIDELATRIANLEKANPEAKPKGKTDGKL